MCNAVDSESIMDAYIYLSMSITVYGYIYTYTQLNR
jgi:hypothetical protein